MGLGIKLRGHLELYIVYLFVLSRELRGVRYGSFGGVSDRDRGPGNSFDLTTTWEYGWGLSIGGGGGLDGWTDLRRSCWSSERGACFIGMGRDIVTSFL